MAGILFFEDPVSILWIVFLMF
ncbi:MAG: hypothetical protein L0Y67_06075 [Gammaproteobacteria bacterium]|nr:hypothetical protein [Gammaproteobacteria bacterium]